MFDQLFEIATRFRGYNPLELAIQFVLIWCVVYLVWRFLRGTRGARVLKGAGLLLLVALLLIAATGGDSGHFAPLRYLLERTLGIAVIAMVIIFQPELRRAMVRIGEARFFRGPTLDPDHVVDELIQAIEYLSKNKIGAIIALERDVGLEGIVDAGTRLNAHVTDELLRTIFWPGTALHDMGVVIREDRIVAAGVQFPLAEDEDLSQDLGSRHRAAIGLSQEADCLVIVVSEETGGITMAERGQLLTKLTPDSLSAMLRRGLSSSPSTNTPARRKDDLPTVHAEIAEEGGADENLKNKAS
ncbi:MAG: diadenylate cyclase CdaA [Planctomycetota bacterium]